MDSHAEVMCPFCWQSFEMPCDAGASRQTLVYDCEVCCNPLEITYSVSPEGVVVESVEPLQ